MPCSNEGELPPSTVSRQSRMAPELASIAPRNRFGELAVHCVGSLVPADTEMFLDKAAFMACTSAAAPSRDWAGSTYPIRTMLVNQIKGGSQAFASATGGLAKPCNPGAASNLYQLSVFRTAASASTPCVRRLLWRTVQDETRHSNPCARRGRRWFGDCGFDFDSTQRTERARHSSRTGNHAGAQCTAPLVAARCSSHEKSDRFVAGRPSGSAPPLCRPLRCVPWQRRRRRFDDGTRALP